MWLTSLSSFASRYTFRAPNNYGNLKETSMHAFPYAHASTCASRGVGESLRRSTWPTISITPFDLTWCCREGFNVASRGVHTATKDSDYRGCYNCPLLQLTSDSRTRNRNFEPGQRHKFQSDLVAKRTTGSFFRIPQRLFSEKYPLSSFLFLSPPLSSLSFRSYWQLGITTTYIDPTLLLHRFIRRR